MLDLSGDVVAGELRPSIDTPTHLELYREFPGVGGMVHVHSPHATAFAQARMPLECLGTTHADHFDGAVPVTRPLRADEVADEYEANTGRVIVEHFRTHHIDPRHVPAVLAAGHGPFVWGDDASTAVDNAVALEACARMAAAHRCAYRRAARPSRRLDPGQTPRAKARHRRLLRTGEAMIDPGGSELWFVTGSQLLYGDEVLAMVADNARQIVSGLNDSPHIPLRIVDKPVMTSGEVIANVVREANADRRCAGLILWMHTFSPAACGSAGWRSSTSPTSTSTPRRSATSRGRPSTPTT